MISKGIIIKDSDNFLENLTSHTKELLLLGGRPLTDQEAYKHRIKITSLLFDIKGGKEVDQLVFSINSILDLISELKLRRNGFWYGDGKYRMKQLQKMDSVFQEKLLRAVKNIYCENDKNLLIEIVEEVLNQNGGLVPYYSKAKTLTKVSDNYLIIELENQNNIKLLLNTIKALCNAINKTEQKKIKYYSFISKPVGKNKIDQNIYMVIDTDKEIINDYWIGYIDSTLKKQINITRTLFPYQYDPIYRFSNEVVYHKIAPIFYYFFQLTLSRQRETLNQPFQVSSSLKIIKAIKKVWFKGKQSDFLAFIDYLLDCWLIFSYDDGLSHKTINLIIKRKKVIERFEIMYKNQSGKLKTIYFSDEKIDKEFEEVLSVNDKNINIEGIPLYKTYLLKNKKDDLYAKKISLFREILFRSFSILYIENRLISYIPFVVKKLELDD